MWAFQEGVYADDVSLFERASENLSSLFSIFFSKTVHPAIEPNVNEHILTTQKDRRARTSPECRMTRMLGLLDPLLLRLRWPGTVHAEAYPTKERLRLSFHRVVTFNQVVQVGLVPL